MLWGLPEAKNAKNQAENIENAPKSDFSAFRGRGMGKIQKIGQKARSRAPRCVLLRHEPHDASKCDKSRTAPSPGSNSN